MARPLDYAETRYSPLKQINATDVGRLAPAWAYEIAVGDRQEATPLMANGTLYWAMHGGTTVAVDARTGRENGDMIHQRIEISEWRKLVV